MEMWVEIVGMLNFLVSLLLIMGTEQLCGTPGSWRRRLSAAVLGGIYGSVCLIPGFRFLGNLLWRLVSLGLMGFAAFGYEPGSLCRCVVFAALALSLEGLAWGMHRGSVPALMLSGMVVWLLCGACALTTRKNQTYIPLEITEGENRIRLTALRDTGNTLRDPVSGEQVLVICAEAAGHLTALTREQLSHPVDTLVQSGISGLRLIPYQSVGGRGLLLAKTFDNVKIGSRQKRAVIAFAPGELGKLEGYQALTGGSI